MRWARQLVSSQLVSSSAVKRFCLLPLAYCLLLTAVVWACPLCKEALFDASGAAAQSGVVRGYALSIAAMLGIPTLLIGGFTVVLVRAARRVKR